MRQFLFAVVALLVLACPSLVSAQTSYNVGIFPIATVDPNTATPVMTPVNYPNPLCGQPKTPRPTVLIIAPGHARFDDPANPTTFDCVLTISTQIAALPQTPVQYVAAFQQVIAGIVGGWGTVSNPFSPVAQPIVVTGSRVGP